MDNLGKRIFDLRKAHGYTLEYVGNYVGVGRSTVRKWENGMIANMRRDKIKKLSEVLEASPGYLMGWTDDPDDYTDSTIPGTFPLPSADDKKGERIAVSGETLSPEEAEIIRLLRQVPDDQRDMALRMINAALDNAEAHRQQSPMPPAGPDKI